MKKTIKSFGLITLMFIMIAIGFSNSTAEAVNYTKADVAAHNTATNCWMILNGNVYNLTTFINSHSGGSFISSECGKDGSALFNGRHSASYLNLLNSYFLGPLINPVLTIVMLTPASPTVAAGGTVQLAATPRDQYDVAFPGTTTTFMSSNVLVATVNNTGLVTGVSSGTATITATSVSGSTSVTGTSIMTVTAPTPVLVLTNVIITPPTSSIMTGETTQLSVSKVDQNGNPIDATITYTSSDISKATVNTTGLVTGVSAGTVTITASAVSGSKSVTGTSIVTVNAIPVLTNISVTPATSLIIPKGEQQLSVSTVDQSGNTIAAALSFISSDTTIATVDFSTGLVTGVSDGVATITTTAIKGSTKITATSKITVKKTSILTIVMLTPASPTVAAGGTVQLAATPRDQYDVAFPGTTTTFMSSNVLVATVNNTGLVTGVSSGTATITATSVSGSTSVTGTSIVEIKPLVLTSISVTPVTSSIIVGGTKQLNVITLDQFGSSISSTLTFLSSNTSLAKVSSTGLVTGVSDGIVTITATATNGATILTGNSKITIASDIIIPVIKMLGESSITIYLNSTYSDAGATAIDNIDGNITSKIVVTNNVDVTKTGSYIVTYNVTDTHGNIATPVVRIVKVIRRSSSGGSGGSNGGSVITPTVPVICPLGDLFSTTTGKRCTVVGGTPGRVLGAGSFNFTLYIKKGSRNNEVMEFQKFINAAGFNCGIADGIFGSKTKSAAMQFQITKGLKGDGLIGPLTRAFLNK